MNTNKEEFYKTLQLKIQLALMQVIKDTSSDAKEVSMDTADLAFCIGSSVASSMFEVIREKDQICNLTADQTKAMDVALAEVMKAYNEKVSIIKMPMAMMKIISPGELE